MNGVAGVLIPQTVTVYVTDVCKFRYGFNALNDVNAKVRVVGLLLKNSSGDPVIIGHYVDDLN